MYESCMQLWLMQNNHFHSLSSTFTVRKLSGSKGKEKNDKTPQLLQHREMLWDGQHKVYALWEGFVPSPHTVTHQRQKEHMQTSPPLLGYPEGSGQAWSPAHLSTSPSDGGWQWEIHRPGGRGEYCSQQQSRREETRPHTSHLFFSFDSVTWSSVIMGLRSQKRFWLSQLKSIQHSKFYFRFA